MSRTTQITERPEPFILRKLECDGPLLLVATTPDAPSARHSKMQSNPTIEGMHKRLHLLCIPHVKRYASANRSAKNHTYQLNTTFRQLK